MSKNKFNLGDRVRITRYYSLTDSPGYGASDNLTGKTGTYMQFDEVDDMYAHKVKVDGQSEYGVWVNEVELEVQLEPVATSSVNNIRQIVGSLRLAADRLEHISSVAEGLSEALYALNNALNSADESR